VISRNMSSAIVSELKRFTDASAKQLLADVKKNAPRHIAEHVYVTIKKLGNGDSLITVGVNETPLTTPRSNYGSRDMFAQEYGAPPHHITPVTRQYLAFAWEKAADTIEKLPDGRVLLSRVEHPGNPPYKGRGFMEYSLDRWKLEELPKEVPKIKKSILEEIKTMFSKIKSAFGGKK